MLMFKVMSSHVRSRAQYSPILVYMYANVQGHVHSQKVTCSLRRSRAVPGRSHARSHAVSEGHVQSQQVTCSLRRSRAVSDLVPYKSVVLV